jgi:MOSC domain-containing protein YiiM
LTLAGLDWEKCVPGTRLQLGDDVCIEITRYTKPCDKIVDSFVDGDFSRVSQKKHPGWSRVYSKVLRKGIILLGDEVVFLNEMDLSG